MFVVRSSVEFSTWFSSLFIQSGRPVATRPVKSLPSIRLVTLYQVPEDTEQFPTEEVLVVV